MSDANMPSLTSIGAASEAELRRSHEELERRVAERTAELTRLNKQLLAENHERTQTEHLLRQQSRLLQAATEVSHQLLTQEDFHTAMTSALTTLGYAALVDRVYLFENHHDSTDDTWRTRQRFEWVRETTLPQIDNPLLQNFSFLAAFPQWVHLMSSGHVAGGSVGTLPSAERTVLEAQGIQSLLMVPIHVGDQWWGFIGFDDCASEREWSDTESAILLMISSSLGARIARQHTEEALRASEERWQLAAHGGNDGIWDWNVKTNDVFFSPRMKEIMGFADDELASEFIEWQNRIHLDDQEGVKQALEEHFTRKVPFYTVEYRLRCKDGSDKWVLARGRAVWDEQGNVERIVGALTDLTERKHTEARLRLAEQIISSTDNLILVANTYGEITYASPSVSRVLGYTIEEILGDGWLKLTRPTGYAQEHERQYLAMAAELGDKRITTTYEREIRDKDGNFRWILWQDTKGPQGLLIGIGADITARKQAETELQRAKEAAEAANRTKSQFLANMSHEIRTPMNGVLGMTELLLGTQLTEKQRRFADTIHNSAESLLNIINDILDFSKIEAGKLELEHIAFDLRQTVEDIADLFAQHAHAKGLEIACHIHRDVPTEVQGDPHRLRQILTNLIGNAIKFTERGEIVIEVQRAQSIGQRLPSQTVHLETETGNCCELRFSVRDTGVGLDSSAQTRLFQPFVQADGSTTRKYGGTGLGLAISKQLVTLMHGEIGVESIYSRGSTFWFTAQFELQAGAETNCLEGQKPFQGTRVLVVDDNATNRDILHHQLQSWGLRDDSAESGVQALQLLYKAAVWNDPYDLAVLDMHMPGMDGIALAQSIKSDPALSATRLAMLTSAGQYGDAEAAQRAGIEAYMSKPVRQSELYNCLATLMGRKPGSATTSIPHPVPALSTEAAGNGQRQRRVLVAEDNPVNQDVARNMLELLDYQVDVVSTGRQAVEALQRETYDLVFMDCQMPELDGFEATAVIRQHEQSSRHTIIVALTANAMDGDQQRCLSAGMDDYLSKPFSQDKLRTILERWGAHSSQPQPTLQKPAPKVSLVASPQSPLPPMPLLGVETLSRLQGLQRPGKPKVLDKVISTYLTDSPSLLTKLQQAVKQNDATLLRESAHSLKGSSATIGATMMEHYCRELEQIGRGQQLQLATASLRSLESCYALTQTAFTAILQGASIQEAAALHTLDTQPALLQSETRTTGAHILLVEDNFVNQQVALGALENLGHRVDVVSNGRAGVDAFLRSTYDAILMDCQMPEMDGFEATRFIREREALKASQAQPNERRTMNKESHGSHSSFMGNHSSFPHIPIIALTANTGVSDRAKCIAAGMDDYLGKPYTQEQLQYILARWLPSQERIGTKVA